MQKFFKQIKSFLLRFLISIIIFFLWGNISFSQAQAQTYKVAQMEGNPERFKGPLTGTEFQLTNVSAEAIQQGILENQGFDILLMPGGSGGEQSSSLGPTGKEKVKEFVRGGGAYLGVCAGAYLGSYGMSYSLGLANVNVLQGNPGIGTLEIQFQEYANNIFTNSKYRYPNKRNIWYYNGPLWDSKPYTASRPSPHFIAKFTGVASQYTPGNVSSISSFKDKPAIVYDYYGNGCVILSSPHAEIYSNLGNWPMIPEMLRWLVNCHGASFSPPPTPTRTPIPTTTPTRTPSPTPAPSVRPSPSPTAHLTPTPTTRTPSPTPSLRLSPTSYLRSSSCPIKSQGDASCDGNINDDDYFVWLDEFKNGTSSTLYADFNNDGKVDLLDFETWRRNGER